MRLKRIVLVFAAMIIVAGSFAACSGKTDKETTAVNDTTVTVDFTIETDTNTSEDKTTAINGSTTEKVHKTTASTTKKKAATTAKKSITSQKKVTTTKKKSTTAKKKVTTKKKTTTTKESTKNVTPSEICSKTNAYIRSKGGNIDTSLRPNASSWDGQITDRKEHMNDGTTLRLCKEYADLAISEGAVRLYCYYDGDAFYILFMPF